ncbi:MAG: CBS domain-containing protein [Chloroflexi bacterium AL-W]|nr:CBS domain-containing protein [Chloroflexi bacterium AL-N1]NOK65400.1 CBS domain-containing protein [Chloroflexi bacterium AL-N10]NOK72334.1 CBS domain-containing protein [Chloroflexi bacterium AL-N5]NOK79579.1 CBS domain-containing protein [Chloroflexi bacterium AL-W]NOK87495.1 CBS domain-containing protein [Chloroflexi bacterium AL-N15]
MSSLHRKRQGRKQKRFPLVRVFTERLVSLQGSLVDDPATTGDQAVKLLEEYLESLVRAQGYRGDGSMGRYASFLREQNVFSRDILNRIDGYTQLRNCLAHTYGLQTSPDLAQELLDFVALLLRSGDMIASTLMTRKVCSVAETDLLVDIRALMLEEGYGRLPVLRDGDGVVGLLIERDLVVAQTEAEEANMALDTITIAEVLPNDAADRVVLVAPDTSREAVAALLKRAGVVACVVTHSGAKHERPLGIITHADLLYRM